MHHFRAIAFHAASTARRLALLLVIVGCAEAPVATVNEVARADFSEGRFCPEHRVEGVTYEPIAPPRAVATDPERLAMWLDITGRTQPSDLVGATEGRPARVSVTGCGESVVYRCWAERGWEHDARRHRHRAGIDVPGGTLVDVMTVCDEEAGPTGPSTKAALAVR